MARPWLARLIPVAGALALVGLAAWGEDKGTWSAAGDLSVADLAPLLGLTLVAYALRWVKWHFLVRRHAAISAGKSLAVFLAGLMLSLTPGKVGELWKAWAVARIDGSATARIVPVVLMERVTDLVAVAALATLGLASLDVPYALPAAALVAVLGFVALVRWEGPWRWVRGRMTGRLERFAAHLDASLAAGRDLLRPRPVLVAVLLSVAAWALEGATLWWALRVLGEPLSMTQCQFIFAAGTLAGAASLIPGGLVAAEASMVALLVASGVASGPAAAATLVVRLSTLWFGAALGTLVFVVVRPAPRQPATA